MTRGTRQDYLEELAFASSPNSDKDENLNRTPIPDQVEGDLVRSLWRWCANRDGDPSMRETDEQEFIEKIDGFLNWAILRKGAHPAAARLPGGLWLDGIIECSIERLSATQFKANGFTFWADGKSPFYLAPFECEFYFSAANDPACGRVIVRFGVLDRNNQLERKTNKSRKIWNLRFRDDSDWAYAIELS